MIPITKPSLDEPEVEAAKRAILSGWVTQGPEVAAFEKEFAAYVGAAHACAVSSCTAALHLALLAVGVKPGDEVITVSHSFIASANSVRYCGAIPVFVDIDPATFNMDPALLDRVFTAKTRAILCVHQMGMPCDVKAILDVAGRHGVPVVEDAACAIGSEILWNGAWERIGKPHGDVACFSFHPRKLATTGDGGMLTTADSAVDRQFRLLRQHGMDIPDTARHQSRQVVFESYEILGFNYRMTDIQASIGREQLKRLPEGIARRRELAAGYHKLLATIPGLLVPDEPPWARSNWQSYCVRLPDGYDQRGIMQHMLEAGVSTRRGIMCAHREPAYADRRLWTCGEPEATCDCPEFLCRRLSRSEKAQDRCILLPLYDGLTDDQQRTVVNALRSGLSQTRGVR